MEEDVQARRSWLSGLGVTLAAFVLGSRKALAQSAESPFRPARHPEDDWLEALPGKHRTFDAVVKELMANASERLLCQRVLDMLVDMKFLCVEPNGAYARLTDGADSPRPHPAKADLGAGTRAAKAS